MLKRGALLAAANWQTVAIQFVAETTFQALLAVPLLGAAVLVAVLLGGDLAELLHGNLREIFTTIARTLLSEPFALMAFVTAFAVVLLGGSVLTFAVKGGMVEVLVAANAAAGPIEQQPLTFETLRQGARFTLERFTDGCARLFRSYLKLGFTLMIVYAVSAGSYLAFVVYGYRAAEGRALIIGWTFVAAMSAALLVAWMTVVNMLYLLLQIAMAVDGIGVSDSCRATIRFIRAEFRELAGVFLVVLALVVASHARIGARLVGCRPDRVRAARRPRRLSAADSGAGAARPGVRVSRTDGARRLSHALPGLCVAPWRNARPRRARSRARRRSRRRDRRNLNQIRQRRDGRHERRLY